MSLTTYVRESIDELHHVRWPTRQQAVRLSIIVLGFTAVSSAFFGAVDYGLGLAVQSLLSFI
ncbi:MAG: preprotein translocase subunit SecE [Candidatus Peregrinibacteria bacterium]|nr:preprotein translocase subunit SecE [Candidatus Peregrinibacteria bacterium]